MSSSLVGIFGEYLLVTGLARVYSGRRCAQCGGRRATVPVAGSPQVAGNTAAGMPARRCRGWRRRLVSPPPGIAGWSAGEAAGKLLNPGAGATPHNTLGYNPANNLGLVGNTGNHHFLHGPTPGLTVSLVSSHVGQSVKGLTHQLALSAALGATLGSTWRRTWTNTWPGMELTLGRSQEGRH